MVTRARIAVWVLRAAGVGLIAVAAAGADALTVVAAALGGAALAISWWLGRALDRMERRDRPDDVLGFRAPP